jgi:hypothetical protein
MRWPVIVAALAACLVQVDPTNGHFVKSYGPLARFLCPTRTAGPSRSTDLRSQHQRRLTATAVANPGSRSS